MLEPLPDQIRGVHPAGQTRIPYSDLMRNWRVNSILMHPFIRKSIKHSECALGLRALERCCFGHFKFDHESCCCNEKDSKDLLPHREAEEWWFKSRYTWEIALLHISEYTGQTLISLGRISQGSSIEHSTYSVLTAIIQGKGFRLKMWGEWWVEHPSSLQNFCPMTFWEAEKLCHASSFFGLWGSLPNTTSKSI